MLTKSNIREKIKVWKEKDREKKRDKGKREGKKRRRMEEWKKGRNTRLFQKAHKNA